MTAAILSESAFVGAKNLPECMAECLDLPWRYVGEVKEHGRNWVQAICRKCDLERDICEPSKMEFKTAFTVVNLDRYLLITDDMLEVYVFFGRCKKCGSIYWAKSGPPFRYARACVPA